MATHPVTGPISSVTHRAGVWLLLTLSSGLLLAQEKSHEAKPSEKEIVELQIYVIRCTNSHSKVDPELKPLYEQLKSTLTYTGYTIDRRFQEKRAIGEPLQIDKLGSYNATVTPIKKIDNRITIKLDMRKSEVKKPAPEPKKSDRDKDKKDDKKSGEDAKKDDNKPGDDAKKEPFSSTVTVSAGKFTLQIMPTEKGDPPGGDRLMLAISGR